MTHVLQDYTLGQTDHTRRMVERTGDDRFRAAVESAPNGMVMIDRAGKIVLVNREIERLFGYGREELLGHPIERLVPRRFQDGHPAFRTDFFTHPQTRTMGAGRELFGMRKDGVEFPVEIGLNPIETEEGLFVLASVVDISARKRAEARFRAAGASDTPGSARRSSNIPKPGRWELGGTSSGSARTASSSPWRLG